MLNTDKIGKNIKALREAHGETQKELAAALYLSVNTISKYERGEKVGSGQKKAFDYDLLKNIAKHYGIAIEWLAESNLSEFKFPEYFYQESPDVSNLNRKIYPVLKPKLKIDNQEFYRAYYAHIKFFEITPDISNEEFEQLIDDIIDGYNNSCEDNLVSLINLSSFMIYLRTIYQIISRAGEFSKIKNPKLKIYSKINALSENERKMDLEDWKDFQETIFEIFAELKKKHFCSDLVDYLIAQMYSNQLIENDLNETNLIVGLEMMNALILLKNPYAIRFIKIISDSLDD
ncbi:helix-turn-helix domain-containing protein [Lactococcus lactis]|uniref:helix-turn-helix domain-containing protein n=1 Tax=Lactococcus lactis TaxID=1358 RepID=UPI0018AAC828|nr:helix-turn-helix transcriptional regulator [Lactococcus lactis]